MKKIIPIPGESSLETLKRWDGYYERPPGGPLVGYAGRDEQGRQYVGMVYANFAKGERHGGVLAHVVRALAGQFPDIKFSGDGFCGAPEGGKALAEVLAAYLGKGYIFPEKQVTALKTETSREKSKLVWGRHEPESGESWWIVEDVCNNFSTTNELIKLIESSETHVAGVICFLNRSLTIEEEYTTSTEHGLPLTLPVRTLIRKKIAEYCQDDPAVAGDIAAKNIVWKPKNEWSRLREAMQQGGA